MNENHTRKALLTIYGMLEKHTHPEHTGIMQKRPRGMSRKTWYREQGKHQLLQKLKHQTNQQYITNTLHEPKETP